MMTEREIDQAFQRAGAVLAQAVARINSERETQEVGAAA